MREFDEANVTRMRNIFATEGYHRNDPLHLIPAVIEKTMLGPEWDNTLQPNDLHLPEGAILTYLLGKHRVLAAQRCLRLREHW